MKLDSADPHEAPANCRNCGAATSGNYCQNCGQETRLHAPSFGEFVHEFVGHYVALEGRLWGTFGRLMFRPGALTNEYLAGRRKRYVEPLRLYLSLSILFFALLKFSGLEPVRLDDAPPAAVAAAQGAKNHAEGIRQDIIAQGAVTDKATGKTLELDDTIRAKYPALAKQVDHFEALSPVQKTRAMTDGFFRYGPYAMFALMPLFALYLKLLYLGSGRRYGEHMLFALHTSSFAFVLFAVIMLLDVYSFAKLVLICWLIGYLPWAMRRVYGSGRFATFARWLALMALHGVSLGVAILAAVAAGAATAH